MKFRSTRKKAEPCSISAAISQGLASDGGLFVPETWPAAALSAAGPEFAAFAAKLLQPFFDSDPLAEKIEAVCARAFNFPVPLNALDGSTSVLELFHGPTGAFKDFGARFLALLLNEIPAPNSKPRLVLVATSGDTGGAVAAAFAEFSKIPVVILYPKGKISPRQEKQLTVWGEQVQAFAVNGSFDDCQSMAKQAFASDWWTSRYQLLSANSINLARLLPQMAYFAFASLRYQKLNNAAPGIIVPSGNAGNAAAALWARKLGAPIRKVIFANNANQGISDYFRTGEWKDRPTIATLANAMDVAKPSNFERVLDLFPDFGELKAAAAAFTVSNEQICETVKREWDIHGRVCCPHTAVGLHTRQLLSEPHWIIAATAHPAKFETILEPLIGTPIDVPLPLKTLLNKPSKFQEIDADLATLQKMVAF